MGKRSVLVRLAAVAMCGVALASATRQVDATGDGAWVPAPEMLEGRGFHTATVLRDGRVLVAGGWKTGASGSERLDSVEIYDPNGMDAATGRPGVWLPALPLRLARASHTATRLCDGRVLVVGGENTGPGAEIYDPDAVDRVTGVRGSWRTVAPGPTRIAGHTATLLPDGRVLVAAGVGSTSASGTSGLMFDPDNESWTVVGVTPLPVRAHTATLLADGWVLLAGGLMPSCCFPLATSVARLLSFATSPTGVEGSVMPEAHGIHTATRLPNGLVLVAGGIDGSTGPTRATAFFDRERRTWSTTTPMLHPRHSHSAVLLGNGQVLVIGGTGAPDTAEAYDWSSLTWSQKPTMRVPRLDGHAAVALRDGSVLLTGGRSTNGTYLRAAELFAPTDLPQSALLPEETAECTALALPTASAGPDLTVPEGDRVVLDGTGSYDPRRFPLDYRWNQIAGPSVTLDLTNPSRPAFAAPYVAPAGATLTFELVVVAGSRTSEPDTVDVTIKNVNNPPVAVAGPDQVVQELSIVTLDGSASYDPDSDALTFAWRQTAGPPVQLSSHAVPRPTLTAPEVTAGEIDLEFQLNVTDSEASADAVMRVRVVNVNQPPRAEAGDDQTVDEESTFLLDATRSRDPDGDTLSYWWEQVAGTPVTFSAQGASTSKLTAPAVGPGGDVLIFRLLVRDPEGLSAFDDVQVNVLNRNDPPRCDLATASPRVLWPPNHKMVPVQVIGASDPDDDAVSITIVGVTQDEPVDGLGDGDTDVDAVLNGSRALVRAERSGTGNGRVYRIEFTAQDEAGASCRGIVSVAVPHSAPATGREAIDDGFVYVSTQP